MNFGSDTPERDAKFEKRLMESEDGAQQSKLLENTQQSLQSQTISKR